MLIQRILATKGTEVVWVEPTATVADVLSLLAERNIGAVLVSDDGGTTVAGVLSERDIVRSLARVGPSTCDLPVAELMTTTVFTCAPTDSLEDAMGLMTERRIRHVPVLDDGKLVGIVSIGDVVSNRVNELAEEARTLHDYIETGR